MSIHALFSRSGGLSLRAQNFVKSRYFATASKEVQSSKDDDLDITSLEEQTITFESPTGISEEEVERKRNKSRLYESHRNILHGKKPYDESFSWAHDTVKYKRRLLGRYGIDAAGVTPGIAWPTKEDVEDAEEYERVLYPEKIQDVWIKIAKKNVEEAAAIRAREEDIARKMGKLDAWRADLADRMAKKEAVAQSVMERKERLIEEVRRHFGFKLDPRDERFKEMLEKKEKEDKKSLKEAKKKARDAKLTAWLSQSQESEQPTKPPSADKAKKIEE